MGEARRRARAAAPIRGSRSGVFRGANINSRVGSGGAGGKQP